MNADFLEKIQSLYQKFIHHDATQTDRIARYRNIEPESAQYLAMLVRIQSSKNILELGTSTGYSTLWLADACSVTQGKLTTVELEAKRTVMAENYAKQFHLDEYINFITGDAADFIAQDQHCYDLILLDAERNAYVNYWADLKRLLNEKQGVIVVDNIISHAAEVKSFLNLIRQDSKYLTTTLNIGAGLFLITHKN